MSLYALNFAPVLGTDISRSLIVVRCKFNFPTNFSASTHLSLTSSLTKANSFDVDQAHMLAACRLAVREMIIHTQAMHRELINARRGPQYLFEIGDKVFSRHALHLDRKRGIIVKVHKPYTRPWGLLGKNSAFL